MDNELIQQQTEVSTAPDIHSKQVNQYGDKSVYAENIENLHMHTEPEVMKDENGRPLVPLTQTRYNSTTRVIYLGNEEIRLPVQLTPQSVISPHELPYINALCEVYAERLQRTVTPADVESLPTSLRRNYAEQRKAYYSAESIQRSVREVFADGQEQFDALKDDAYDGISTTYYDDRHTSGYDRLLAVLNQIASTTLTKSALMNISGLIGNLEKKGVCHILVNDDRIKSWVNIDE